MIQFSTNSFLSKLCNPYKTYQGLNPRQKTKLAIVASLLAIAPLALLYTRFSKTKPFPKKATHIKPVQKAPQNKKSSKTHCVDYGSASVLPYYVDETTKDIFYLIGLDKHHNNQGADFGGLKDSGEKDPRITATRECREELIDLATQIGHSILQKTTPQIEFVNKSRRGNHITYLVNVSKVKDMPKIQSLFLEKRYPGTTLNHHQTEKTNIFWISGKELSQAFTQASFRQDLSHRKFKCYEKPSTNSNYQEHTLRWAFINSSLSKLFHVIGRQNPTFFSEGIQNHENTTLTA